MSTIPQLLQTLAVHATCSQPLCFHTVSGLFLSLSSLRSKHWLMMGFSELHITCQGRARSEGVCSGASRAETGENSSQSRPRSPGVSLPAVLTSFKFRKRRSLFLSRNPGRGKWESRHEKRCPVHVHGWDRKNNSVVLTTHAVGHLPSIVQKAELPSIQRFPCPLVSQLMSGGVEEREEEKIRLLT